MAKAVSNTDAKATATTPWFGSASASASTSASLLPPPKSGLEAFVRAFGARDLIACSTLQPDLEVFATSFGAFAYRNVPGTHVTLGGPLCATKDRLAMLDRFRSFAKDPLLSYVRADVLRDLDAPGPRQNGALAERGLRVSGMGKDHLLDVPKLLASPGPEVANAVRKAQKAKVRLVPFDLAELAKAPARDRLDRLDRIDQAYLEHSECNEVVSFLNWPLHARDRGAHLRRAFWLEEHDGESSGIFGVVPLNPIFDRSSQWAVMAAQRSFWTLSSSWPHTTPRDERLPFSLSHTIECSRLIQKSSHARSQRWEPFGPIQRWHARPFGVVSASWSTPLGKLLHQQMIPIHYLAEDRAVHKTVMRGRAELGRRYRGY